jgi:hypothetical protein
MNATTAQAAVIAALIIAAVVVIARFEVFCLRELARASDADVRYLTRGAWVAAIILIVPLGGIASLYCGRPQ